MYGLPARELTPEERLQLGLNINRVNMLQVHNHVIAAQVAAGELAPLEYFELFHATKQDAQRDREETYLRHELRTR